MTGIDPDATPPGGVPATEPSPDGSVVAAAPEAADAPEMNGEAEATEELASEIAAEITELSEQRDQYRDLAQRVQADFENYRKRVQAQMRDEADRATAKLAASLLPVLDATEAAYLRHPDEIGPLLNVLLSELKKEGLETLHLDGEPFDPNVAEAVAHEAGDGGEVIVAEVLRSGYRWNGRTLRPAMVRTRD